MKEYSSRSKDYISFIDQYGNKECQFFFLRFQFFHMQKEDRNFQDGLEKNFEKFDSLLIDSKSVEFSKFEI